MRFAKYHGIGNDFVFLADPNDALELTPELVQRLSSRRFGIGGDGVIRVAPAGNGADLFMDYVNSDGSVGEMCGNGIRCLAVFAKAEGLTDKSEIKVDTRAGIKTVSILDDGRVRVDMGAPIFAPDEIPIKWSGDDALHAKIDLEGDIVEIAALSMGNPHAVIFVDHSNDLKAPIRSGPLIERHEMFPNGTNVEFARVESPDHVRMRVWERGSGETLACGTGACAVAVATRLLEGGDPRITVSLPGGDLEVEWNGALDDEQPVYMTGPVVKSFEGDVDLDAYRGESF
ncbi:MAG: diaminopimelate epimerase [Actinomycetota bacterium]|jgi:diaminopimelate epimerase|nr:diaminopimelate epimerase [Actinomycetota bacterium]